MQIEQQKCILCNRMGHQQTCSTHRQRFVWRYGGNEVSVVGDWSKFQVMHKLKKVPDNPYMLECFLQIQPGIHRYKYVVDGRWTYDPNEEQQINMYNTYDNILKVFPAVYEVSKDEITSPNQPINVFAKCGGVTIIIQTNLIGNQLFLKGSWDNWQNLIKVYNQKVFIKLNQGIYYFKFIVDDVWKEDPSLMRNEDGLGGFNNVIKVNKRETGNKKVAWSPNNLEWSCKKEDGLNFTEIQGHSMNIIQNNIYIFGGFFKHQYINTIYQIDVEESEVYNINAGGIIPDPRAYHQQIKYGNKIIVFGGLNQNEVFNDYLVFNSMTKAWQSNLFRAKTNTTGDIPSPRERCTLTKINKDILVLFGGYVCSEDETLEINYNETFQLNLINLEWNKLDIKGEKPMERQAYNLRSSHVAVNYQQILYIFGGVNRDIASPKIEFNDVWALDTQKQQWSNISNNIRQLLQTSGLKPSPRYGHACIQINNYLVSYGGKNEKQQLLNELVILDLKNLQWIIPKVTGEVPGGRIYHALCVNKNNDIFMLGGFKGQFFERKRAIYCLKSKIEN